MSLKEAADLPAEYKVSGGPVDFNSTQGGAAVSVVGIDSHPIPSLEHIPYVLSFYRHGDSVNIATERDGRTESRGVVLVSANSTFDLLSSIGIGGVFFVFAIYVISRHRCKLFAVVLHLVSVCAAVMIVYDWGSLAVHGRGVNFVLRISFDAAIWLLPALFFHFSCIYPREKTRLKSLLLLPWYMTAAAGIAVSVYYLAGLFFLDVPVDGTHYVVFHSRINDMFLIAGLLGTVVNLEHSALRMEDAVKRRNVYWVLLGIFFGPLVYVFLILVPRNLIGMELISDSLMQYTLLMAPLMFWKVIR